MKCVIDPNLSKKPAYPTAVAVCDRLLQRGAVLCMDQSLAESFAAVSGITFTSGRTCCG